MPRTRVLTALGARDLVDELVGILERHVPRETRDAVLADAPLAFEAPAGLSEAEALTLLRRFTNALLAHADAPTCVAIGLAMEQRLGERLAATVH